MLTEDEVLKLNEVFYKEAPYDYVLAVDKRKPDSRRGFCNYYNKVCVVYDRETYEAALLTVFHEIAHARTANGHTVLWEREWVSLLRKYKFPKEVVKREISKLGPALKEYVNAY